MCKGYWYECECEDCKKVAKLYEDLEWYEDNREDFGYEIAEIENEILALGYWLN